MDGRDEPDVFGLKAWVDRQLSRVDFYRDEQDCRDGQDDRMIARRVRVKEKRPSYDGRGRGENGASRDDQSALAARIMLTKVSMSGR